mgnify:CR=1 FL=1
MKSNKKLKAGIFVLGIALAGFLSYELFYWLTHVYEFDARISRFNNVVYQIKSRRFPWRVLFIEFRQQAQALRFGPRASEGRLVAGWCKGAQEGPL